MKTRASAYTFAALFLIVGVARGLDAMQEVTSRGGLAMVLGFMSLDGILPMLLGGILIIELGSTIDSYLEKGVFNFAIVSSFFTITGLGLILAGLIEIVNDIFVRNDFISNKVQYVLGGMALTFISYVVNDWIGAVKDSESGMPESTPSLLSQLVENYRAPLLKIEKQIDDTTVILLYILSLIMPLAGFVVGAIYATKKEEHYKYVGKNCLIFSVMNFVISFIMVALLVARRAG